jgi:outer membrane protein assembly factor BamB
MLRTSFVAFALLIWMLLSSACPAADTVPPPNSALRFPPTDWPCWRGAQGNGIASSDQSPPLHWSKSENALWKANIPGRGHSSPIVVGDRVIITTADEDREIQSVLCFERNTGASRWQTTNHRPSRRPRSQRQ